LDLSSAARRTRRDDKNDQRGFHARGLPNAGYAALSSRQHSGLDVGKAIPLGTGPPGVSLVVLPMREDAWDRRARVRGFWDCPDSAWSRWKETRQQLTGGCGFGWSDEAPGGTHAVAPGDAPAACGRRAIVRGTTCPGRRIQCHWSIASDAWPVGGVAFGPGASSSRTRRRGSPGACASRLASTAHRCRPVTRPCGPG